MLRYTDYKIRKLCPNIRLKLLGIKSATTQIYTVQCSEASCSGAVNSTAASPSRGSLLYVWGVLAPWACTCQIFVFQNFNILKMTVWATYVGLMVATNCVL
jgi:hypothetical protein